MCLETKTLNSGAPKRQIFRIRPQSQNPKHYTPSNQNRNQIY